MDDERTALEPNTTTDTTRRLLLRAAVGRFTLAASGLFLLQGLEETEAREGAAGGRLGGRHGKDHRTTAGATRASGAITVLNFGTSSVHVQGWQSDATGPNPDGPWSIGPGWDWSTINGVGSGRYFKDFKGEKPALAVFIEPGYGYVVHIWNDCCTPPHARILTGGWDAQGWHPTGSVLKESEMPIDTLIQVPAGIRVQRDADSTTHIRFRIGVADLS